MYDVADYFGCNVFGEAEMRKCLSPESYEALRETIDTGKDLSLKVANEVAEAMKNWAVERGATHYTHWFQPLTGATAEKHDSFISAPDGDGRVVMELSGKELIKGETDGSSFPSGGLRSTFEARGYTTWDCTSPAFLKDSSAGPILCIPTAFCSYTGEALDKKTPLLRSMEAINAQAIRILRLFGNETSKKVVPSVGAEQEYFLIDRGKYLQREDMIFTGRTLFGAKPPKGQEMDDHYFGKIRERIGAFMKDVDRELWRMGVTAKTEHNEVAPAQHELAPIYAPANVAADHNQLVMETLKRMAKRHGLRCLLSEKPFEGVNGSGKHNNWSLTTDDGINMLNPGKTPHKNAQFMLVLACIIEAVDIHAALLRESAADAGNDLRLGADEAPPAIISIFLGDQLQDVVEQYISTGNATTSISGEIFKSGVSTLPDFVKDATDRNRTSPFAFTGNKFEFRSVGSNDSISEANVVLNAIVAESFCKAADALEGAENKEDAIREYTAKLLREHKRILFNGDGYSAEWVAEAKRRGLPNSPTMVDAVPALTEESSVKLFERFGIFNAAELASRAEIAYENYAKTINIEALTMIEMASKQIIPAVIRYVSVLGGSVNNVRTACPDADVSVQRNLLKYCSERLKDASTALNVLKNSQETASKVKDAEERAKSYRDLVIPAMKALRRPVDELEMVVDKTYWPMPTYGDILFEV